MNQQQSQTGAFAFGASGPSPRRLSSQGEAFAVELAARHGFGREAVTSMLAALDRGQGGQAQFNHPELGGLGQWSQGGMLMIGDMFNNSLKARVGALAEEAAVAIARGELFDTAPLDGQTPPWPAEFGTASAVGSQNDMHYAFFPAVRKLVITRGGLRESYDTGDHRILGFSQQQGSAANLTFSSQHGTVPLSALQKTANPPDLSATSSGTGEPGAWSDDELAATPNEFRADLRSDNPMPIIAAIEGLADLHAKGILDDAEFAAKKAELLGRI